MFYALNTVYGQLDPMIFRESMLKFIFNF